MRKLTLLLTFLGGLGCAASARADVTYDIALTPVGSGSGGSGTITLSMPPANAGTTSYDALGLSGNSLTGIDLTLDGFPFDLSSAQGDTLVQFGAGELTNFTFDGVLFGTDIQALGINGLSYNFADALDPTLDEAGTVSATPAGTAITPEPSSMTLLGTGLLASFGMVQRRRANRT